MYSNEITKYQETNTNTPQPWKTTRRRAKTNHDNKETQYGLESIEINIQFDTKFLTKGGIQITLHRSNKSISQATNTLLQTDLYPPNIFGPFPYIHIEDVNDTRPWLCINKVPTDANINELKDKLQNEYNIKTDGMHRKVSPRFQSTLIKFKVQDETQQKTLLDNKINIFNRTLVVRKCIKVDITRCTSCQELTCLRGACRKAFRCVRCANHQCPRGACHYSQ